MKPLIKNLYLFIFLSLFSTYILSSFPNEHVIILDDEKSNTNNSLRKAINISSIRILGSRSEFDQQRDLIRNLLPQTYIKSYEFINPNKIKIIVNAKLLRKKFLDSNLSISLEERSSIAAWILCKTDLNSKNEYDLMNNKCKKFKKELLKLSNERDIKLIFPILDSNDLNFLGIEQKQERANSSYINNRYLSDESFYCEVTLIEENCYKTYSSKSKKIDFSKKYSSQSIYDLTADSLQKKKKVYLNKKTFKPVFIRISNVKSIEEYDLVSQELENIIFFDNLLLNKLNTRDVIFSSNLLGKISDIEKLFKNNSLFSINSINYAEIFLEFNPI